MLLMRSITQLFMGFIAKALESVRYQSFPIYEVVVIDDASTDGTAGVVTDLQSEMSNLKLISLPTNKGAAAARNVGIKNISGEVVAFLDSDDYWYVDKVAAQMEVLAANTGAVAVFCGMNIKSSRGVVAHIPPPDAVSRLKNGNTLGTTSAALVLRDSIIQVGGFDADLPSCQDWDLWLRLSEVGDIRVVQRALLDFILARWRADFERS
jgi:glycosyltransferase involved in cell wall biosynthesis